MNSQLAQYFAAQDEEARLLTTVMVIPSKREEKATEVVREAFRRIPDVEELVYRALVQGDEKFTMIGDEITICGALAQFCGAGADVMGISIQEFFKHLVRSGYFLLRS